MLPLGLHFGLSEEEHHADPGLGSSDMKGLLYSPPRWQFKRLKDLREALGLGDKEGDGETLSKQFGSLIHTVVLEGMDAFDARYVVAPDMPADVLTTKEAIREKLGRACTLPSTAKLYDYEVQAKLAGFRTSEDWKIEKLIEMEGREEISKRWRSTMILIDRVLDAPRPDRDGRSLRDIVLTDGFPEVSFFWIDEETGVRCKARFDWLRPGPLIDLKTHGAQDDAETIDSFTNSISRYCYDLQAAHYIDAYRQITAAVDAGLVQVHNGATPDQAWLKRLARAASNPDPKWIWLAVQTIGMPEVDDIEFDASMIMTAAWQQVRAARGNYVAYRDRYGEDDFWVAMRGRVILQDQSFPGAARMSSRAMDRWTVA